MAQRLVIITFSAEKKLSPNWHLSLRTRFCPPLHRQLLFNKFAIKSKPLPTVITRHEGKVLLQAGSHLQHFFFCCLSAAEGE